MAVSKTARTIRSSVSNAASGTTTGTAVNLTTALGMLITAKVTNGATGPTIGCLMEVLVSYDGTNYKVMTAARADTANNAVTEWAVDVPPTAMYANVRFSGNTAQAVTVEAFGQELTGI